MKKRFLTAIILLLVAAVLVVCTACDGTGGTSLAPSAVKAAYVPAVLTGGAGYESRITRGIDRALDEETAPTYVTDFPYAQWETGYPNWSIVPKVSLYFNNLFVQTQENFSGEGFRDVFSIENETYTMEGDFNGDDIARINDDGTAWERFYDYSFDSADEGYSSYARYQEGDDYRRGMRILFMGAENEILELYENAAYKFIKVIWWSNASADSIDAPKLTHFVSVMDKSTADEKTTARQYNESFDVGDYTTHVFSSDPGTTADTDYYHFDQWVVEGGSSDDCYGYFNKTDYEVTLSGYAATSGSYDDYIDPDLVTPLLDEGMTEAMWPDLKTKIKAGESIDFIDWTIPNFE